MMFHDSFPESGPPRSAHPIEELRAEHQTVLGILDDMEREALRLVETGRIHRTFWERVLRFHTEFHDRLHHDKEEHLLFPAIEEQGIDPHSGPTAMLRAEHQRGRFWVQRIEQMLTAGDVTRLHAAVTAFVEFQRQHIRKEDEILFPLAMQLLPPLAVEALRRQFAFGDDDGMLAPPMAGGADGATSPGGDPDRRSAGRDDAHPADAHPADD